MSGRVLVVDDDGPFREMVEEALRLRGFEVSCVDGPTRAIAAVESEEFDVCVSDVRMSEMSGTALCRALVARRPRLPVILVTGFGCLEAAVAAIRAGAYDFLSKPVDLDLLEVSIRRAIERSALIAEVTQLREQVRHPPRFDDLIGRSDAMQEVFDLIGRVAASDVSLLVTGESGTGKELVARAVHRSGSRAAGPFVAVNCAAIPHTLLESQLFGHVRGAFTDAHRAQTGLFVQAQGGTLLLDEIGELPTALQPKLLRAIQERCVLPVGAQREVPFDARIIAATNRDLDAAVDAGTFREDLLYRINVVQIHVPPLRSRGADVLLLAQALLEKHAARSGKPVRRISAPAAQRLVAYPWPGNVRELENCMERAVALARFEEVGVEDLPPKIRDHRDNNVILASDDPAELPPLEVVERRYVLRVLEATGGHRTLAAKILGLDRKTLYRKLRDYGVVSSE